MHQFGGGGGEGGSMMFNFPYLQMHFELINAIFKNQRLDLIRAFSVSEMQTVL